MRLCWEGETPFGTSIQLQIRTAASKDAEARAPWVGPAGPDSFFLAQDNINILFRQPPQGRWIQYRAVLAHPTCASTPLLTKFEITYETAK